MPKAVRITAIIVFTITAAVWAYALTQHTFLKAEFWIYAGIFAVPGLAVCTSLWLTFLKHWAWKLIGTICLLLSLAIWVLALLLVWVGFRIH